MKTASKIIVYVLIVLALVGVIGFIAKFTSGFTSEFKTFYVTIGDKDIMSTASDYTISKDESLKVDVKYTFNSSESEVSGYSVKIIPNAIEGKDFDFTVDGEVYSFQKETDLSDGFYIEESKDSFIITPKGDLTDILRAIYPDAEVSDCTGKAYPNMFTLVVTSYNGESSVIINFAVMELPTKVILDKESIIF